jgi:hypothetical protein
MGATIDVKQQQSLMIRLVGDKLVKEEAAQNLYIVPPKGEYQFQVTGYALPFEMPKSEDYGGGTQTMTRVEFTITEGKGKGKLFTQLWGFSIGPKSNLGRFCRLMKMDLTPANGSWDLDNMIGYTGSGYLTPSETLGDDGKPKYTKLSLDTVEGISAPEKVYVYTGSLTEAPVTSNGNGHQAAETDDGWPEG